MTHLLVIGGPSLDRLHFNNRVEPSAGGAGLYTALAAHRSGCRVSMFSPKPNPMPGALQPLDNRLETWLGPTVTGEDIPRFEIAHSGDQATYLSFFSGAEVRLDPAGLPQDLSAYDAVHITSLGRAHQQLRFAEACRARGAAMLSCGSHLSLIEEDPDLVERLFDLADLIFLNEAEARAYFGSLEQAVTAPGKVLWITRGRDGALVVQGNYTTELQAIAAEALDPTGAGDTFCGATVSLVLQGAHPIMAARRAMALASEAIQHVGPTALLFEQDPPAIPLDERVRIDEDQVARLAGVMKTIPEAEPVPFVSDYYPPVGHPAAMNYFFVQTLQQFSFWHIAEGRYSHPLVATIDGHQCKGSTYLSYAYLRPLEDDAHFYSPQRQAQTDKTEMLALFRADDGTDPMPAVDLHLAMAQAYGRDMSALGLSPQAILARANQAEKPLKTFLSILDQVGGYKEDPFRKKSNLLAMILKERPEGFLRISADEAIQPVIDYHVMRFCLRTGLVEVIDAALREKIAQRILVSAAEEWAIRFACYRTIQKLIDVSGLSMGAVDNIAFNYNRQHCPEMTEPICAACALDPACVHRKHLFQPVIRTTFY
ncbi:MAG: carbohydrate kinase family protein [Brevefilum sp.]